MKAHKLLTCLSGFRRGIDLLAHLAQVINEPILIHIIVPLSKPVIATVALFTIVSHWNDFFQGLVLSTDENFYPLQTYIKQLIFQIDTSTMTAEQIKQVSMMSNTTLNAAKIFISMIPVLCIYPFLQKYFVTGIQLGGVKE